MAAPQPHVGVLGAGAIGCYLGGRLLHGGARVTLVGRAGLEAQVAEHGLTLTDLSGARIALTPERARFVTDSQELADCDVVLVTVKSRDTPAAAQTLRRVLPPGRVVVSFQNGVRNRDALRAALTEHTVLGGMVPFNVLREEGARFHQGTDGRLVVERSGAALPLLAALERGGLPTVAHADVAGVLWGKLLVNLGNAVNALSGVPLQAQLADRRYRRILAQVIAEGVAALKAAGIQPRAVGTLRPTLAPKVLPLPDWLFRPLARAMVQVDPQARSSMWEDLERRRPTEIEFLNGEVVALAKRHGVAAPFNRGVVALIREAEAAGDGSPQLGPVALRTRLEELGTGAGS